MNAEKDLARQQFDTAQAAAQAARSHIAELLDADDATYYQAHLAYEAAKATATAAWDALLVVDADANVAGGFRFSGVPGIGMVMMERAAHNSRLARMNGAILAADGTFVGRTEFAMQQDHNLLGVSP
jgi:multidrug efflux pump subunit AcrA (membrane-fusion protein)